MRSDHTVMFNRSIRLLYDVKNDYICTVKR